MKIKYRFKDVVLAKGGFLRGPFGGDLKKEIFVDKGEDTYKVYEQGVVLNANKNLGRYYISEKDYKAKLHKFSVQNNDFLVSCSGVNMGAIYQLKVPFEKGIINQALLRIRLNNDIIDDNFFNYLFKELISRKITSGSGDSTIPNFPGLDVIKNIEFDLPDKKTQSRIGHILTILDSKIDLNNRINAELEQMAKTIYDYWFVQFDFPISAEYAASVGQPELEGKPYKSSGGKMVWSEELKREVPEGFLNCTLGDVVEGTGTGLNPRDNFVLGEGKNYYVTIKNIKQGRVILDDKCDKISDESLEIINKRSDLKVGDILFTSIEPVGLTYLILDKPKNWNINESVFTIRPDYTKLTPEFLFMFLSADYIKSYTKNVSAGSIHKGIRHSLLKDCKFILPERNIVDNFTLKIQPIIKKLDVIQKENQKLTELRDWLLPMLMNGQVKVGDVDDDEMTGIAAEPMEEYKVRGK